MSRTRLRHLAAIAVLALIVGWIALRSWHALGHQLPGIPWTVAVLFLVLSVALFAFGWSVRQYLRGKRPTVDGIRAARTAAFAKAACYVGAAFAGWYGGYLLTILTAFLSDYRVGQAIIAGISILSAAILAGTGYIVEGFCRIPPSDDDGEPGQTGDRPEMAPGA